MLIGPAPQAVLNVNHYHQRYHVQPNPRHVPNGHELIELVTGGHGWVEHDGEWLSATAGCLFWHGPGDQSIGRSDPQNPYRCLAVLFETPGLIHRRLARRTYWSEQDEIRSFTRETVRDFVDESFDRQALCLYIFGRLCYQVARWESKVQAPALPIGLRTVLDMIEHQYGENLCMEDLARAAGWSVPHLHASCRRYLQDSPHQLLMARRLHAAKEMLASSDLPIKQISMTCGYATDAALCRQFKRGTGMTPTSYRRQHAYRQLERGRKAR